MTYLRLGTRRSPLARAQSEQVADLLRTKGHVVDLIEIVTEGDRSPEALDQIGGTGVFAGALRQAVRAGDVDLAVHSLKDLPTVPEPGLVIAATPPRADTRDALVARDGLTLGELPPGARVGTGSPRRQAQLAALGLGLDVVGLRGNVDTRLAQVRDGLLDAVVLARAGLERLGRTDEITESLDPLSMLPAAGQGALAVECREDRADVVALCQGLDDPDTRACVTAERALLRELEAGCTAPVGVLAEVVDGRSGPELSVRAVVSTLDGRTQVRRSLVGAVTDAVAVGERLALLLLDDGGAALVAAAPPEPSAAAGTAPADAPPADTTTTSVTENVQ